MDCSGGTFFCSGPSVSAFYVLLLGQQHLRDSLLTSVRSSVIFLIAVAQVMASFSVETQLTCVLLVRLWPGV